MNDEHEEDYTAASEARIGADRMALGLGCIPDKISGDMERVKALEEENKKLKDRAYVDARAYRDKQWHKLEGTINEMLCALTAECLRLEDECSNDEMRGRGSVWVSYFRDFQKFLSCLIDIPAKCPACSDTGVVNDTNETDKGADCPECLVPWWNQQRMDWIQGATNDSLQSMMTYSDRIAFIDRALTTGNGGHTQDEPCTHDELDHGICLYCGEDRDQNSNRYGKKPSDV